jgi:hypothetical protein
LEVWTDLQCAGGTRTAILPLDHVTRLVTTERVTREDDGTLELSKDANAYGYLSVGAVIRLLYTDAAFEEWRIAELSDTSQASRLVRVTLQSVLFDLNVRDNPITSTTSNVTTLDVSYATKTPTQLVTAIMAFAPSWFDVGTVTPTTVVDVSVSSAYPLRGLRAVVDALRARGVDCELDFRRNGTTGYYLDLVTTIGSSASAVDVRTAKNLLATTRAKRLAEQATSVIMRGGAGVRRSGTPTTIALGFWKVASVSGSDVELRGAEDCPDPILYDDQFNSHYLQKTDGTYTQITDTVASTQKVTVASAASISANQWLRIVSNSSGDDMVKLSKPTATAPLTQSRIVPISGLTDRTNWCVNAVFARWTAGAPDDWTETDTAGHATISEESSVVLYGSRSCKVVVVQPGIPAANVYMTSRSMSIAPSASTRDLTASAWIYVDKSLSTGTPNGTFYVEAAGASGSVTYAAITSQTWTRINCTASSVTGVSRAVAVRYQAGSTAAQGLTYYIGAAMLEEVSSAQSTFIVGSQPAYLHAAGNRVLGLYSDPPTAYTVSFADLGAWDATAFPYDNVTLGATANVSDTDLGVTTSDRIVEITRDRRNPLASQLTVSTRPVDLVSTLTGIADL